MLEKFRPRSGRWEGFAFTGAYVFALAVALLVLLSSKHETRSLLAWAVFAVFALCLTGIFLLYRWAAKGNTENRDWSGPAPGSDPSHLDR
jgi:hypothetical protein